jgi:hypothetical protein
MMQDEMLRIDVQPDPNGWRWSIHNNSEGQPLAGDTAESERAAWEGVIMCVTGSASAAVRSVAVERDAAVADAAKWRAFAVEAARLLASPGAEDYADFTTRDDLPVLLDVLRGALAERATAAERERAKIVAYLRLAAEAHCDPAISAEADCIERGYAAELMAALRGEA